MAQTSTMGSLSFSFLLLSLPLTLFLITPTHSLICSTQNFKNNNLYPNCTDLPTLNSTLHWNYHRTNSSLSIAFTATPSQPNGWIAWAINPTGDGMLGAQSLIAFKQSNGSMVLKTYNISSYRSIMESRLSFDVVGASAEASGGVMRIFATLALPDNMTTVNQVWQVGGSVVSGVPEKHEFGQGNLNAKGTLELMMGQNSSNNTSGGQTGGNNNNTSVASSIIGKSQGGFYVFLLFFGSFVIGF